MLTFMGATNFYYVRTYHMIVMSGVDYRGTCRDKFRDKFRVDSGPLQVEPGVPGCRATASSHPV